MGADKVLLFLSAGVVLISVGAHHVELIAGAGRVLAIGRGSPTPGGRARLTLPHVTVEEEGGQHFLIRARVDLLRGSTVVYLLGTLGSLLLGCHSNKQGGFALNRGPLNHRF